MPSSLRSGLHQAGSLKILNNLIDGIDSVRQTGAPLKRGDYSCRVGFTSRAGRTGRPGGGDATRKVVIIQLTDQ